jgi:hypothetical protein
MNTLLFLLSTLSLSALAHEGHGIEGATHYHPTDAWGFVGTAAVAALLWWFSSRGK